MRLPFKIALRFLLSSKGQTALIVFGIAIGVSVQIFIGSLIEGLQESLISKTIGNSPQITISSDAEDKAISSYQEITDKIKGLNNEVVHVAVAADGPALIKEDKKTFSVLVRGMNVEDSDKIYNIKSRIYEGQEPINENETIIGKELKQELGVNLGDEIQIITNSGDLEKLKVTGFYDLKVASLNKSWMITPLSTSQKLFSFGDKVTSIEMQVKDVFKADETASAIAKILDNKELKVDNWKAQNAELLSGLNGQNISSIMIQIFVLVSVVLGIASVLAISVVQKSKQIGILKAMGIKDRTASFIFLFQGLILGVVGSILGVVFGLFLSYLFSKFALTPEGTPIVELAIHYRFITISALIALASAVVAALIPARGSLKLNPMEVIKNG
ncbi:ABC transporter permease [Tepidibacillus fermentans]|uniref:Lipoprotein-releasing system permease protein n=1 Tax=Tepidibacillus fermentans TaxID=1281767 RepID=A0A4R3KGD6_9BACI|nr:ABC transporter permease [Tepidibacillus fermentans]TCS82079.1 lipoprotein-releasing system permease protein [Tepidibacillus fermentans]